ncbi:Clavaminate synthase-like protein [Didymella exigua CBS 183.55]|uniref:Clavaminate synthase-like protein n=1 Tax=Didymella exigua CBS 183.55 TaxID=1150837 RepID=A0A6A5RSH5_9PLEO|nr:Clavaminate synthase-like protein [Didymella exigua CBS 183.55]KAF1931401.1 Clavaminate synthase-like protein [Didymella exigua CBS 183.55]
MSLHSKEDASSASEPEASDTLVAVDTLAATALHTPLAALNGAPTRKEITQLTRHELSTAQNDDSITECGRAALALLHTNPELAVKLAYQKLHDVPYKEVKTCWRRLYTDASLRRVLGVTEEHIKAGEWTHTSGGWLDEVVKMLDMVLILTAAPGREELVELWFAALEEELASDERASAIHEPLERPAKKMKLGDVSSIPSAFPTALIELPPTLRHPIPRSENPSLFAFQKKLSQPATHTPLIITNSIQHWPALSDRPWNSPPYLLKRTLGGRRLVPIETGHSYTDSSWGQKITSFKDFMATYMLAPSSGEQVDGDAKATGYLAQHDLFAQIPSLRSDISIPDYCYASPNPYLPINIEPSQVTRLEDPLLNAWFGPSGTISPLHTDPYHNILAQVVGYKYVRCYKPEMTERLYPRGREGGVDMGNTSEVDLDEAVGLWPKMRTNAPRNGEDAESGEEGADGVGGEEEEEGIDQRRREFDKRFPEFRDAEYIEGVLGPGECLYLPPGWWHYVRSLSSSFSVSFWFN